VLRKRFILTNVSWRLSERFLAVFLALISQLSPSRLFAAKLPECDSSRVPIVLDTVLDLACGNVSDEFA